MTGPAHQCFICAKTKIAFFGMISAVFPLWRIVLRFCRRGRWPSRVCRYARLYHHTSNRVLSCCLGPFEGFFGISEIVGDHGGKATKGLCQVLSGVRDDTLFCTTSRAIRLRALVIYDSCSAFSSRGQSRPELGSKCRAQSRR